MNEFTIIEKTSRQVMDFMSKNSPTILTGLGVAGLITTVALAIRATPKAMEILYHEADFRFDQWEKQTGEDRSAYPDEVIKPLEAVELTWKCYIPTIASGLLTISCMIGSNHISLRRNAALISLYSIAETTLKEYQEKVVEQIGENKAEKIKEEIAQDHLDKNPVNETKVFLTGKGSYLCFDDFSKRYFKSDIEEIRKAVNIFNQRLIRAGWLGINDFYDELGLEPIELGDEFGWIAERALLEPRFDTKMAKDTNEPCLVIGYTVTPNHI